MAWSNRQKMVVHEYARHAGLSSVEYRTVLCRMTGAFSSREQSLDQFQWEDTMTQLERIMERRIQAGEIPRPANRRVASLDYWRRRFPLAGAMTSRQRQRIEGLWDQLVADLDEWQRSDAYLAAIARKACGHEVHDVWHVSRSIAGKLINALQDRLHYGAAARGQTAGQLV